MIRLWVIGMLMLSTGCAARNTPEANAVSPSLTQKAEQLMERGAYLEASYYLEAELQQGGDERAVLPLLIEVQIRADLLHAAMHSLKRLHTLAPDAPVIEELFSLLVTLTGVSITLPIEEV